MIVPRAHAREKTPTQTPEYAPIIYLFILLVFSIV